jgi:hypothetical protein
MKHGSRHGRRKSSPGAVQVLDRLGIRTAGAVIQLDVSAPKRRISRPLVHHYFYNKINILYL